MNNDLISREALKKAIDDYAEKRQDTLLWQADIEELIDNAPAVEEVSVIEFKEPLPLVKAQKIVKALSKRPQGEWISDYRTCKCSICNFTTVIDTYNFCPNCGADMRKEADSE